jgi:hypothetical protein
VSVNLGDLQDQVSKEPREPAVLKPPTDRESLPPYSSTVDPQDAEKWYDPKYRLSRNADGSFADYASLFINTPSRGSCFFNAVVYEADEREHNQVRADTLRGIATDRLMIRANELMDQYRNAYEDAKTNHQQLLSCTDALFHLSDLLNDDSFSECISAVYRYSQPSALPSPTVVNNWLTRLESVRRSPYDWAYCPFMQSAVEFLPHNVTVVDLPHHWFYPEGRLNNERPLTTGFSFRDYGKDETNEYRLGHEVIQRVLSPTTIFIQFVGNHFQTILFLSTEEGIGQGGIVHVVPSWERHKWLMRLARYWGLPRQAYDALEGYRRMRKCGFRLPGGLVCGLELGHCESSEHRP